MSSETSFRDTIIGVSVLDKNDTFYFTLHSHPLNMRIKIKLEQELSGFPPKFLPLPLSPFGSEALLLVVWKPRSIVESSIR